MNCGAVQPCRQCGLSIHNTVHTNIGQYGHHDYVSPEEEREQPGMSLYEAAGRMIAELKGFYGHDYALPELVQQAMNTFKKEWGITDEEIERWYVEQE